MFMLPRVQEQQRIIDYDRLAILDSGRVVEAGSPAELVRQNGAFASLVASMGEAGADILRKLAPHALIKL